MTSKPEDTRTSPLASEPAPSGMRALPVADWRDALLDLASQVPIDGGDRAVVDFVVAALHGLLPGYSVGACVADGSTGEQVVVARGPDGATVEQGRDPTRLFPDLAHERIVPLGDGTDGATLHVAGDDAGLEDLASDLSRLTARAAVVLATSLARARRLTQARESSAEVHRLQAQMIQAEKLASLGQIVAGVVHELNNPLTSIVAYSDYLERRAKQRGDAHDEERLRRIAEAAERILKFSRDLVAYARPTSEIPAPVSLGEVIDKALVFCEHEFSESSVRVVRAFPQDLPPVRGIGGQLIQVFVNLFTNAAHSMSGIGGELTVRTVVEPSENSALVEVADQGVGIDPAQLQQIFDPFFTTKTDGRGTGLGLSIVRKIVTSHGGTLSARSTPGEGTVFRITLPLSLIPPG